MPLNTLPLEVLHMILGFVGGSQLQQQDACTLVVSRWWYDTAKPIVLEELNFTGNQLILIPERVHEEIARFTRRITLDIHGVEERTNAENRPSDSKGLEERGRWEDALVTHLEKFSMLLSRCTRLGCFTFRAHNHFDPREPFAPRREYLSTWSPIGLINSLPTSKLSELVIDTYGSEITENIHICPCVVRQIPLLRFARFRMRRICPQILDINNTSEDPSKPPKLESFIINLSLAEPDHFSAGFSHHCTKPRRGWDLFEDMVTAGSETAKRIPTMKVLRILCHKHPFDQIVAKDCITGTKTILPDEGEWDWGDEGKPDPEDLKRPDQESEISDLSDWSDA